MMPAGVAGDLPQSGHVMALKAVHELQRTKLDHNSWRSVAGGVAVFPPQIKTIVEEARCSEPDLVSHHTVRTEEVWAVEAAGHGAGLPGLAAGAVGSVQLGVVDPGDPVVREEPGHAGRSELAVRVTAGTRDLLRVFLQSKNINT